MSFFSNLESIARSLDETIDKGLDTLDKTLDKGLSHARAEAIGEFSQFKTSIER